MAKKQKKNQFQFIECKLYSFGKAVKCNFPILPRAMNKNKIYFADRHIKLIHENNSCCTNEQPTQKGKKGLYIMHSLFTADNPLTLPSFDSDAFWTLYFLGSSFFGKEEIKNVLESFRELLIKRQNEWTEKRDSATKIIFLVASIDFPSF